MFHNAINDGSHQKQHSHNQPWRQHICMPGSWNSKVVLNISQPWNQVLLYNSLSVWYDQLVPSQKSLLICCATWLVKCGHSLRMGHYSLPGYSESFKLKLLHFLTWIPRLLLTQTACSLDRQLPWGPRLITERHLSTTANLDLQLNSCFFGVFFPFSRVKFQPQLAQTPRSNSIRKPAGLKIDSE